MLTDVRKPPVVQLCATRGRRTVMTRWSRADRSLSTEIPRSGWNDVSASSHQPGCSRCMHRSSTRGKMSDSVWSHWVDVSFQFPLRIQLLDVFQAPVHILLKTKLLLCVLIFCKHVKSFSRHWKRSFWETFPGWRYSETPSSVLMCRQGFLIVRQSSDWSTWPYSRGHISTCFLACAWQPTFAF